MTCPRPDRIDTTIVIPRGPKVGASSADKRISVRLVPFVPRWHDADTRTSR